MELDYKERKVLIDKGNEFEIEKELLLALMGTKQILEST